MNVARLEHHIGLGGICPNLPRFKWTWRIQKTRERERERERERGLIAHEVDQIWSSSSVWFLNQGLGAVFKSLKCAHAFQCEGRQNNHTSLKISKPFLQHFTEKKNNLIFAVLYRIWYIIWCLTILKKYMQQNDALQLFRFPIQCAWSSSSPKGKALQFLVVFSSVKKSSPIHIF
jgi:hypothetical protein